MPKEYKAKEYMATIHHGGNTESHEPWDIEPEYDTYEIRYRIVSIKTGEVLDDADGYGYKTAQKAYSGYAYKTRDKSKEPRIKKWLKEHQDFSKAMEVASLEIAKGSWGKDARFNPAFVNKMLRQNKLTPDFSATELLKVWRKTINRRK